ncbi:MAG: hypothetical protein FD179_307 [Erysipelotrichaceae bacterium]|nr:MAG: hypothetical protein FD179_307 [Erysipelotrichaceae bacterium]
MKAIRLCLCLVMLLNTSACGPTETETKIPDLRDETIRAAVLRFFDDQYEIETIDKNTYDIEKTTETHWIINGSLTLTNEECTLSGKYTLLYDYQVDKWILGNHYFSVTNVTAVTKVPTSTDALFQTARWFEGINKNPYPIEEVVFVDQTLDLPHGLSSFTYTYTLVDGPYISNRSIKVVGSYEYPQGWVFDVAERKYDTTYNFSGVFNLTWDILDGETYYINNETATLELTGQIRATGSLDSSPKIESNTLSAKVTFRGESATIIPTLVLGQFINQINIQFGDEGKESFVFVFGQEEYRGITSPNALFYAISIDNSHAKVTQP